MTNSNKSIDLSSFNPELIEKLNQLVTKLNLSIFYEYNKDYEGIFYKIGYQKNEEIEGQYDEIYFSLEHETPESTAIREELNTAIKEYADINGELVPNLIPEIKLNKTNSNINMRLGHKTNPPVFYVEIYKKKDATIVYKHSRISINNIDSETEINQLIDTIEDCWNQHKEWVNSFDNIEEKVNYLNSKYKEYKNIRIKLYWVKDKPFIYFEHNDEVSGNSLGQVEISYTEAIEKQYEDFKNKSLIEESKPPKEKVFVVILEKDKEVIYLIENIKDVFIENKYNQTNTVENNPNNDNEDNKPKNTSNTLENNPQYNPNNTSLNYIEILGITKNIESAEEIKQNYLNNINVKYLNKPSYKIFIKSSWI